MMMESSPTAIAPLLLKNLLAFIFVCADKSFVSLCEKYKLLQPLRHLLVSSIVFFLRLLPSFFSLFADHPNCALNPSKTDNYAPAPFPGDSGIARALSQLLSILNEIPVSSRKYDVVRSLAETLIHDNLSNGSQSLRDINRSALSAAFSRRLVQLEAAVVDKRRYGGPAVADGIKGKGDADYTFGFGRVLEAVRVWTRFGRSSEEMSRSGNSAEKLAAEMLWLAQKLSSCGAGEEAVSRWASASDLAWLALSAEPRLQGSLVKLTAFLFKQAKEIGGGHGDAEEEESRKEESRQTKLKMFMSWLPLLCRASNGLEAPVLSVSEKAELEKVLEETIESLEEDEQQEKVLCLWLHHFAHCPSSDWPNLYACYARWCIASRTLFLK